MFIFIFILINISYCKDMFCPTNDDFSNPYYFNILIDEPYICKYYIENKMTLKLFNNKEDADYYKYCYTVLFDYKCIQYTRIIYPYTSYNIHRDCFVLIEKFKSYETRRNGDDLFITYTTCNIIIFGNLYAIRNMKSEREITIDIYNRINSDIAFDKLLSIEILALYLICYDIEDGLFEFRSIAMKYYFYPDNKCKMTDPSYHYMYGFESINGTIRKAFNKPFPQFNIILTKVL